MLTIKEVNRKEELLEQAIDRFWETVPPVWNRIRGQIRATAAEQFGISVEQFHILRHIRKGIQSVSELAEEKGISRPAISQAVELLVEKGLIARQPNPEDRRFIKLELTQKGNELLDAIFQKNREWMYEKLSVLSEAETETILLAMEALNKTINEPYP